MIATLLMSLLATASFLGAASASGHTVAAPAPHSLQSPCADAQEHSLPLPTMVPPAQFVDFEKAILAFLQSGGTVDQCPCGSFPLSCSERGTHLPIPTATTVGGDGKLYASIWALVPGLASVVALP